MTDRERALNRLLDSLTADQLWEVSLVWSSSRRTHVAKAHRSTGGQDLATFTAVGPTYDKAAEALLDIIVSTAKTVHVMVPFEPWRKGAER